MHPRRHLRRSPPPSHSISLLGNSKACSVKKIERGEKEAGAHTLGFPLPLPVMNQTGGKEEKEVWMGDGDVGVHLTHFFDFGTASKPNKVWPETDLDPRAPPEEEESSMGLPSPCCSAHLSAPPPSDALFLRQFASVERRRRRRRRPPSPFPPPPFCR